ncbi:MAG: beta-lactamase family protein [Deltaproteobacteria bacterium]|jgi:CubicO group peptidase (beta-lactamase class C family)|nr:beta-lactamase family protein [Deltaproteobacteria bacterium]MBT6490793.1 beta-lactamase family protein [Deltaproteobacteria bacterium]
MQAVATQSKRTTEVNESQVESLLKMAQNTVSRGDMPSVQVAVAHHGALVAFETYGEVTCRGESSVATNDTLYVAFSTTKAVVSIATWLLMEDGKLKPSDEVSKIIPGFVKGGKGSITVEHLLTHTAGFPRAPFSVPEWEDKAARHNRFESWTTQWEPGSRFVYHANASMWALAQIIEAQSGMDYRQFIRSRITAPLGLDDLHIGLSAGEHHRVADIKHVGTPPEPAMMKQMGLDPDKFKNVSQEQWLSQFDRADFRTTGAPGSGGIMTAASLALFYQGVLGHLTMPDGKTLLKPSTVQQGLQVRTHDLKDPMTGQPAGRSLGLVIAGGQDKVFRGFAPGHSDQAFGHPGAGGQVGWADPHTGLSFALLTNGLERNPLQLGMRAMSFSNQATGCIEPSKISQETRV